METSHECAAGLKIRSSLHIFSTSFFADAGSGATTFTRRYFPARNRLDLLETRLGDEVVEYGLTLGLSHARLVGDDHAHLERATFSRKERQFFASI